MAAATLIVVLLLWIFRRLKAPVHVRFSILFLFPTALVTLSAEWAGALLLPQPNRYHLEMEMAVALVVAFMAKLILDRTSPRVRVAVASSLLLLCILPALRYRSYARHLIRPVDIRQTIEYREAQWFDQNLKGRRVFAHGSVGFFLNVFTDTPQYAGGFDPGVVNPTWAHVQYQILSGENAGPEEDQVAVLWLRAFGVDAVSVSGPRSEEAFKPFRNPHKFDGILPELWRDGDDVIYQVPRRSTSLAHVIRPPDLPSRQPVNGLDVDPARPYVAALEDPALPTAQVTWRSNHAAVISARMEKDQILSVQITYHPGWTARVGGQLRRTYSDHLGQLVVEPECEGPCTVEISYDGGFEMRLARAISWAALMAGFTWILLDWRRRTRPPKSA
jgi:hypothetical protein